MVLLRAHLAELAWVAVQGHICVARVPFPVGPFHFSWSKSHPPWGLQVAPLSEFSCEVGLGGIPTGIMTGVSCSGAPSTSYDWRSAPIRWPEASLCWCHLWILQNDTYYARGPEIVTASICNAT